MEKKKEYRIAREIVTKFKRTKKEAFFKFYFYFWFAKQNGFP